MMDSVNICLIRHGTTYGNSLARYIGVTDEPLLAGEPERLGVLAASYRQDGLIPEEAAHIWVSPLIRCRQTAAAFYPEAEQHCVSNLRECDFGKFENKNYREMDGDPDYQRWVDSNATLPFPGGESVEGFTARTVAGFRQAAEEMLRMSGGLSAEGRVSSSGSMVLFVHGGSIMSIMSACLESDRAYYEWHVQNAEGYRAVLDVSAFLAGQEHFLSQPERIGS